MQMTYELDAIYAQGMRRPLEPLVLPEGTVVHLRVEQDRIASETPPPSRMQSPRLAHPEQIAEFTMDVREIRDAGV